LDRLRGGIVLYFAVADDDASGLDPFSVEAEITWLPVIGPTGFVLARKILRAFDGVPAGTVLPFEDTVVADAVGVLPNRARQTLARVVRYKLAENPSPATFVFAGRWPVESTHVKAYRELRVAH
jgi:hypothetical protein